MAPLLHLLHPSPLAADAAEQALWVLAAMTARRSGGDAALAAPVLPPLLAVLRAHRGRGEASEALCGRACRVLRNLVCVAGWGGAGVGAGIEAVRAAGGAAALAAAVAARPGSDSMRHGRVALRALGCNEEGAPLSAEEREHALLADEEEE